jgi:hypothetical protein
MRRYILNSAVLTAAGLYRYEILTLDEARKWLEREGWESHIRYESTVIAMESMLGNLRLNVDRTPIRMQPGDEALIMRLTVVLSTLDKRNLTSPDYVREHCELGLLRRID